MHSRRRCWSVPLLLLAACASAPPAPRGPTVERDLALPPAVVAAIAGGALRAALPFGDPVPHARGVMVQRLGDDHWRLAFACRDGDWLPLASHRLALAPAADRTHGVQIVEEVLAAHTRTDRGAGPVVVQLDVHAHGAGARLTATLSADLAATLDRAIALALDPGANLPGLEEPNLATWAEHRLLALAVAAEAAGDSSLAHAQRQAAARLLGGNAALQERLAEDAERHGEFALATDLGWQALLTAGDAHQRASVARRLAALAARGEDPAAWRAAARERLADVDLERAAAMLHTARRLHDEPALDYRLQSRLHKLRQDGDAAEANALLAREHSGLVTDLPAFVAELWLPALPGAATVSHRPAAAARAPLGLSDVALAAPGR